MSFVRQSDSITEQIIVTTLSYANEGATVRNKIAGFIKITGESTFIFIPSSGAAIIVGAGTKGVRSFLFLSELRFRESIM